MAIHSVDRDHYEEQGGPGGKLVAGGTAPRTDRIILKCNVVVDVLLWSIQYFDGMREE